MINDNMHLAVRGHTHLQVTSRRRRRLVVCAAFLNVLLSFNFIPMAERGTLNQQAGGSGTGKGKGGRGKRKPSDKPRATWTDEEQKTIVDFLHTKLAEGGDQGTFKGVTWNALVDHLLETHPHLPAKDVSQVKGKWKTVRSTLLSYSNTDSINVPADEDSLDCHMRLQGPLRAALGPCSRGEYTGKECRGHMG